MKTILIIYTNQKLTGILDIAKYQTYSFNTSIDIKVGDLISSKEYSTNMQVIKVIDKALALYNRNTGELSNEYTSTAQGEIRNLEDLIVLKDEDLTVLKEKDIALRKIEKTIVVPERSNSTNLPIFEIEDTIYLMNNDQQNAYNIIKYFIKERLKNKELIGTDSINFNEPLSKKYSGIIPIGMWNNMIGIIGKGGTGKTSLINKIISDVEAEEKLENKYSSIKFKYVAPTHNAVTVLQESLGLDSEEVGSVRTTASLVARNQSQGSDKAELGNPNDELLLLRQDIYKDEIMLGKREPISGYDIIIVDESSMISGQDIRDIMFRFEAEHQYNCYSPIFIFMGDYRQLPPINTTIDKSFQEGIISATLFSDKYKEKHLELSQIMRSKNEDLHKIFDSIGDQITEQRKDFNLGKPIKLFDFSLFDSVSNKSTNNVLVVKESHIEIMIDNYVDVLINNKYPYEMFWVHYNNTSHLNTQKLFKTIRKCYFEKLKLPIPENNVIAVNDYVQFKGALPVKTIEYEGCKGTIKPTARFKVISRGEGQYPLYGLIPLDKFIGININAEFIVVYNRQGKERLVYAMKKGTLVLGSYNPNTKTRKIIVNSVDEKITLDIPYRTIKEHMQFIQHYLKTLDDMFALSYIGSSHTVQGLTIKKIIVGDYNIRQNSLYIAERDMESSLYTSLTRASEKLIIIKPNSVNIENNQSIFKLVV